MFDFTQQIPLEKNIYKTYGKLQKLLYLIATIFAVYMAYLILFPSAYFAYDFSSPNSLKNSVISPRDSEGKYAEHGAVASKNKLVFDTALVGNYGKAKIEFAMDKKSDSPDSLDVSARKSYQAFFYPEGEPMASKRETVYKIGEDYYLLSYGALKKFASRNAYLSQYDESDAEVQEASILKKYPLDQNLIGYADGTLISYGISAYIVSSGKLLPINNTATFSAMGYNWNDVKQASADEISMYEKDKLFTISSPHPNGTVFTTTDTKKSYLIENGFKRPVLDSAVLKSQQKNGSIAIEEKSLTVSDQCRLAKETFSFRTYSCDIPLDKFGSLIGKDYEFSLSADQEIKIDNINVTFKRNVNWDNFKATIRDLINRIKTNYGFGTTAQ